MGFTFRGQGQQLELPNFLSHPEAASVNPHPVISSLPIYILNNLGPQSKNDRRFDMLCTPIQIEEQFELHLPLTAQLLVVPTDTYQQQAGITYRSSYRRNDATVVGNRFFERAPSSSGHFCTVEEILLRTDVLNATRKDLRNTVLFKLQ